MPVLADSDPASDSARDSEPRESRDSEVTQDSEGGGHSADTDGGYTPIPCDPLTLSRAQSLDIDALMGGETPSWDEVPQNQGPGLGLGDLDGDGWLDLLVAMPTGQSVVYRNDGTGQLVRDDTFLVAGAPLERAYTAALADIDADGDLDAFLTRSSDVEDEILVNSGAGSFERAIGLPGSQGESKTGSFGDADGDGDLDLFVGGFRENVIRNEIEAGTAHGDGNYLYVRSASGDYTQSKRLPESIFDAFTYQGAWVDYDRDGDQDLYLTNDHGDLATPNALLDQTDGQFSVNDDCYCSLPMKGMGIAIGDPNGDDWPDLYLTNWGDDSLLQNLQDGGFVDVTQTVGALPADKQSEVSWGAAFVDLNLDTWEDLAVVFGDIVLEGANMDNWIHMESDPDALFLNNGDGTFRDASEELDFQDDRVGRAVVVGDLDRDGRPDLVTAGLLYVQIWRAGGGCGPGVTLDLDDGATGNRDGLGAEVEVALAERSYTRWLTPSSTNSSSAHELYLGLGEEPAARQITVRWPGGGETVLEDVKRGAFVTARRE